MKRKRRQPPRLAEIIIDLLVDESTGYTALGDYAEEFHDAMDKKGYWFAALQYWSKIFALLPVFLYESTLWSLSLIRNYLKTTFRNLLKHKGFSTINVVGLALSMSVCLMIVIFIKDQKDSDRFHENKDRIVRVFTTDKKLSWDVDGYATTPGLLGPYLSDNYPFIQDLVRLRKMWGTISKDKIAITVSGLYAEPSFFDIFSYELRSGSPTEALRKPFSIIISDEVAHKFFGNEDPINKTLPVEQLGDFTVTGVFQDTNLKSHLNYEVLVSFNTIKQLEASGAYKSEINDPLSYMGIYTYALLRDEGDKSALKEQLPEIAAKLFPDPENQRLGLSYQSLSDINLGINLWQEMPGTMPRLDIVFIPFLAILIMVLACFNYIILSIARALKRSKEIGLRKVVGARRSQIVKLFLIETFTVAFLALIAACLVVLTLIPIFNGIDTIENNKLQLNIEVMKDPGIYGVFILFAIIVSLVAGLYPAIYLSSLRPIKSLQGIMGIKGESRLLVRKILMSIQFAVSLVAIIFVAYFYQLHTYWTSIDRGITTGDVVSVSLRNVDYERFKNEAVSSSSVSGISFSNIIPVHGGGSMITLQSRQMAEGVRVQYYSVDTEFIENFGIKMLAGRNFSESFSTDTSEAIIVNERFIETFDLGSPREAVGHKLYLSDDSETKIVGVVRDFNYRRFFERAIGPFVFRNKPEKYRYANIKFRIERKDEVKAFLTQTWQRLDEVHPISLLFLDDAQELINRNMSGTISLSGWGCGFVILISLFGLFGMATYTTELRTKEIGIRRVLGASGTNAAYLLSKNYFRLILIAAVFALPVAYFGARLMFQFFAYRPEMSPWVLPGALMLILALALLTISTQTLKVAFANPVNALRIE